LLLDGYPATPSTVSGLSLQLTSPYLEAFMCGVAKTKRPEAAPDSAPNNVSPKALAYDALFVLNQHFEQVLQNLDRVRQLGLLETRFQRKSLQACRATIEETRAWINFEITESLHDREQRDWTRFGKVRRRWEKKYEDPNDALIKAERLAQIIARRHRPR
jgi:hypothetical protein